MNRSRARNFVAYQDGVWYGGTASTYPAESCPHCLNRGGTIGQCGVINGRSYDDNLNVFGQPMAPAIQAQYAQGQEIVVDIVLTAHHKGHFEFFACPIVPGGKATGDCFKNYTLTFVADELYGAPKDTSYPTRAYIAPPSRTMNDNTGVAGQFFRFRVKLPDNLSGDLVLLQWHYLTANSCKYPGYTTYPFPQDWGDMQDFLGICTNIPADGNGTPGTCCCDTSFSSCRLLTRGHLTQLRGVFVDHGQSNFGIVPRYPFLLVLSLQARRLLCRLLRLQSPLQRIQLRPQQRLVQHLQQHCQTQVALVVMVW